MLKIETFDSDGRPNGWLLPIWNENEEPGLRPAQVYVTAIAPGCRKGPHLHMERRGVFFCVAGKVAVVRRIGDNYTTVMLEPGGKYGFVGRGTAAALYNLGTTEALVLNMPNPAWTKQNPDDHPVTNWTDPDWWPVAQ